MVIKIGIWIRRPLAVVLVLGSDPVHVRLQILHGTHALDLSDGQGKENAAHNNREDGDAQPPGRALRMNILKSPTQSAGERSKYPFKKLNHMVLLILPGRSLP
jgi:hypothetical protein